MPRNPWTPFAAQTGAVLRWLVFVLPMSLIVGTACAGFLWSLDQATRLRYQWPGLLFGLPLAGMAIGLVYQRLGRSAEGGNNLIVDQIHGPGLDAGAGSGAAVVPRRMAPLILVATVVTHLFGGSAGREGTAVQMGGSIASGFARACRLGGAQARIMLMAGIAAGFGAVFGTPIAGAIFALEVLSVGRIEYEAILPCLIAALAGDWACHAWGIEHTAYTITALIPADNGFHISGVLLGKVVIASVLFGLGGLLFAELSHAMAAGMKKLCPIPWLRPGIGGVLVIALTYALGTRDYLGLGVWAPDAGTLTIPSLFQGDTIHYWSWLWKTLFTVVTLGSGFKGGEVTPLFFIGAALGNALSGLLGAPTDLMAGLGFIAIFAAAANTPLACTLMGIELFGSAHTAYIAVACFTAYAFSGYSGIYLSQRVAIPKTGLDQIPTGLPMRQVREAYKRAG